MIEEGINQEGLSKILTNKELVIGEISKENSELQGESKTETQKEINRIINEIKVGEAEELGVSYEYGIKVPELDQFEMDELVLKTEKIKRDCRFALPALFKGNRTATNYDSKAVNYSTVTNNIVLSSGKELFAIYNYKSSGVHRFLDTLSKKVVGLPMMKANFKEWPEAFRKKSLLPVLDLTDNNGNIDRNMIILERIPNINMYDLISNFDMLKEPNSKVDGCSFVKNMKREDLIEVVGGVAREVANIHNSNKTWGELVPSNIIIDKNQKIHICDPETVYNGNISINEQKAYDLLECITSFSSVMNEFHQIPYVETINTILNTYMLSTQDNEGVIFELKKIAEKKFTFVNKLGFAYLKVHLSLQGKSQLMEIRKKIIDFETETI